MTSILLRPPHRASRRAIWLFAAALLLTLLFAPRAAAEGGEPRYFAIKNARVVPVSGAPIDGGTVVVASGLIVAVGTNVPIPPEAWVIDGKGLTVYPGLIAAGSDLGLPKPEGQEGAGGVRGRSQRISMGPEDRPATTPWLLAADEFKTEDKRIASWREAGFTTALVVLDGGFIPGQASVMDLSDGRVGGMVVKAHAALGLNLSFHLDGFRSFPDSLMGAIAYVRQVLDDAAWTTEANGVYNAHAVGLERPPYDRAVDILNLILHRRELVLFSANDDVEIPRALRLASEWNLPVAIYGGQQAYAVADQIAAKKFPVIVNLKWPEKAKDADPEEQESLRTLRFRDRAPGTPATLAKAGVKFAFATQGLEAPNDAFKNVKKAMDAGLSSDAALRALTLDAAEIIGLGDRLGSIEAGKIANLVVTDGDIFNEKTKVKHVFVDGRWFEVHEEAPPPKSDEKKSDDSSAGTEVGR